MSIEDRFKVCIAVSFALHFLCFGWSSKDRQETANLVHDDTLYTEFTPSDVVFMGEDGFTMDSLAPETASDAANKREMMRKQYLKRVSDAVHARRLRKSSAKNFVGSAWITFGIYANGAFTEPQLTKSSGRPDLDEAALEAARLASGVVRRPAILGSVMLKVTMPVKFQFGL